MQIKEIEISKLKEYENNPRNNEEAVEAVANSINEFGFKVPIIIDKNNTIIAGHTRLLAAKRLKLNTVPVIVADDLTEEQIKAFRLVDNKTAEIAEWDFQKLEKELQALKEIDMSLFGFDVPEVDIAKIEEDEDFDIEEAIPEDPNTSPGDIYKLGNHILMCGDSTIKEDLSKLLANNTMDLLITDPPYNIDVSNSEGMKIENDNMQDYEFKKFLHKVFRNASKVLKEGGAFYVWHADSESVNFRNACNDNELNVKQCLIWVKNSMNLGRQDYQWKHEPCLYGWKEGTHYFIDDRTQETVIEDRVNINKLSKADMKQLLNQLLEEKVSTTVIREDKPIKNTEHPTMKPVKLISRLIKNSSKIEENVLDLFGGSGTTLIACEQLNRKCFMMELDPKYCDVIIERWEKFTGEKAVLMNG